MPRGENSASANRREVNGPKMSAKQALQNLYVFDDGALRVSEGVALGDAMSFADDLVMDDVYEVAPSATRRKLALVAGNDPRSFYVAQDTDLGTPGNLVVLDCCVTFMVRSGATVEALLLVEVEEGNAAATYVMPLAPLYADTPYRLVGLDRHGGTARLAEFACVSFTKGTHITLATGKQVKIEELQVGDRVLTRDDGPQPVRWIGHKTIRATGAFAPVVIRKGVLHNENDLELSPDHRVFVWQRQDEIGAGRAEVLVKVRHLIDGENVYQRRGGFVDYYQLLFDDHQIIYAEGIAAESLLIDQRTRAAIPEDLAQREHDYRPHLDFEVAEGLLPKGKAAAILRRASQAE